MAEDQPTKYEFFVYIVESPSAVDLYHGRSEGTRVAETIRLDGIPCLTRTAINKDAFQAALQVGLPEAMKQVPGRYPVLHLSAHGSVDGIALSSGEVIPWHELREFLVPINQSLQGALLLCMSACKGYGACQMAMQEQDVPHPYFVMVGSSENPTWSDTAVSYLTFYHLLAKGRSIDDAVAGMSAASGIQWVFETAEASKQYYLDFLKSQVTPEVAQKELTAVAEQSPLPPDVKSLEEASTK